VNEYDKKLMQAPSLMPMRANVLDCKCVFCGKTATNAHHIVPRSHGGLKGPLVPVCGMGNASGCHGLLHKHMLHMRYTGVWEYLLTKEPMKYDKALMLEGWRKIEVR